MASVRRVRRLVRKIDPWTVLKVSLVFNTIASLAFVLGVIIFWSVLVNAGIPDAITRVDEKLTITFSVNGEAYFRAVVFLAVVWTIMATGLATLAAVLYNLISDVVGGIEIVVLEEVLTLPQTAQVRSAQSWAAETSSSDGEEERRRLADLPTQETTVSRR
jgi:signal transduction histidine kinase